MKYFIVGLLLAGVELNGQGFSWWNNKHNWDGTTHWSDYLTLSPAYMGPNALPVPSTETGNMPKSLKLQLAGEAHLNPGDQTQNLFTRLFIPFKGARVGISLSMVPIEHYRMDTITRDLRAARDYDAKGFSVGDLYIGTHIQLVREQEKLPDIMLTINLKTASGNNLYAVRFTDTPGYYFNVSVGKDYQLREDLTIRPHFNAGLYVWQTHAEEYFQNDALMYGLGFNFKWQRFEVHPSLDGYHGYLNNGDRPMVFRTTLKTRLKGRINYIFRFQEGLHDYPYTSLRLGCEFDLSGS